MGLRSWVEQGRLLGCAQPEAAEGHPQFVVAPDGRIFEVDRDGNVGSTPLPGRARQAESEAEMEAG
jgi:hypothetical protein